MNPLVRQPLDVVILQHPQEPREPLSSASALERVLAGLSKSQVTVKTGLSWPNLKKAVGKTESLPSRWIVFYLGSHRPKLSPTADGIEWIKPALAPSDLSQIEGLLFLDGTWKQAKTLWWRNPWLLKLRRAALSPSKPSLFGASRREPRRECLSTFESAVSALEQLEDSSFLANDFKARALEAFKLFVREASPQD